MKKGKLHYFNKYVCLPKFFLSVIFCLSLICCGNKQTQKVLTPDSGKLSADNSININLASAKELEKLPQIGEKTAQRIIKHRQKYGNFRKPEHLILVQGISDKKFRQLKNFVTTEWFYVKFVMKNLDWQFAERLPTIYCKLLPQISRVTRCCGYRCVSRSEF